MYQKIATMHQVDTLHKGVQLVQYPLEGISTGEIDLSDPDAYLIYEVCAVESDNLKLRFADSPVNCDPVPAVAHPDANGQLEVRVIPASQLISDGNWWIEDQA